MHSTLARLLKRSVGVSSNNVTVKAKAVVPRTKCKSIAQKFVRARSPLNLPRLVSLACVSCYVCCLLTILSVYVSKLGAEVEKAGV